MSHIMNGSRVLLTTGAAAVAGQTINVDGGTAKHCGWGAPTRTR
jgi:hypothetical protein